MPRTFLNTEQAAAYLGLKPCTLADWRWRRQGPPWIKLSPGCVRYDLELLDQWLTARTIEAIPRRDR